MKENFNYSKNFLNLLSFLILTISGTAQDCEKSLNVFFDFDKDHVKRQYEKELLAEIDVIGADNITSIEISGHSDSKGSSEYNVDLANRRNKNVKKVLPRSLLSILKENAYGELKPFEGAEYEDDKRLQNNRRVEVLIKYKCGGDFISDNKEYLTQSAQDQQQLDQLISSFQPTSANFKFTNDQDRKLETSDGTIIWIPAHCFVKADGSYPSEINLEIIEYYDFMSILSANLTTHTSDGIQLETGGMIYLEATDENGEQLELNQAITCGIPYSKEIGVKEGMELYTGIISENGIEWELGDKTENKIVYQDTVYLMSDNYEDGIYIAAYDTSKLDRKTIDWIRKNDTDVSEGGFYSTGFKVHLIGPYTKVINVSKIEEKSGIEIQLGRYFLNTTHLGYINCDRSILEGVGGKNIQIRMQRHESFNGVEMTYLVFKDVNGFAEADRSSKLSKQATFSKIPEGLEVILISLIIRDGNMFFTKEAVITSEELIKPNYKIVTQSEFKNEVEGLLNL